MEHFFELPVMYKDEELLLKGRLVTFAYTYKFYVIVHGQELIFERDDEQKFRVLSGINDNQPQIDPGLVAQIVMVLNQLQS
ncbi:hypothetical protein LL912_08350 [Niabella sp. CC-SYL272]|uniref:hypothetical protein n=1 Tax=Niabella agricola TaxID=2891571 RepID=UPI001F18346A|nr:hypothetical protein [Niabella agricola]MCF3108787.1 hypothetical protein [Niabella agricola]